MNIAQQIASLQLPKNSYIVVGSGILGALGIREAADIDLVVTQEVYDHLENQGWNHGKWGDHVVLQQDVFDIGTDWYGRSVHDLLQRAQYVENVPYMSLEDVYNWKKTRAQPKDLVDMKLIEIFQATK